MPIYEFQCSCGIKKEVITFSVKEKVTVPFCGKCEKRMRRLPSSCYFTFVFDSGTWEKQPDGTEKYRGKGGVKASIPGFEGKLPQGRDLDLNTRAHLKPKAKNKVNSIEKGPSLQEEMKDILKKGDYEIIKDK